MSAYATPEWLQAHLDDPDVRVLEASIAKETYDGAHIPGAQWVDFHRDLLRNGDESSGYILTPEQYAGLMSRLGVTPQTTVVWYGDRHSSYAIRGFWMMDFYRHPGAVHVLEGGRERWLAEGRPTTADIAAIEPAVYPVPADHDDASRAEWQRVRHAIESPTMVVFDVRSQDEYDGTSVRAARGGHIPGAVHLEWTGATAGDNVLKPESELREMYESRGVTPDKEIIAHCQLRDPRRTHLVRAEARPRLPERPQLRRFLAGVGQPRRPPHRAVTSTQLLPSSLQPPRSVRVDLVQAIVADAEVVRDLVPDDARDALAQVRFVGGDALQRAAEDHNAVGQRHVVVRAAARQRHAAVDPEQHAPHRR